MLRKVFLLSVLGVVLGEGLLGGAVEAAAEEKQKMLFDFSEQDASRRWRNVNDGVMGGRSQGRYQINSQGELIFYGNLSLRNNGGFASVRSNARNLQLGSWNTIAVRVRGDGRKYFLDLRVPTYQTAFSYRVSIQTKKDTWQEFHVPLKMFQATSFGRPVRGASSANPSQIDSVGFTIADKREGAFQLNVDWIKAMQKKPKQ